MTSTKKILGVIAAREGSKGLPGKNLARIGSYSLVQRAVMAAQESSLITHICVSTDSEVIKKSVEEIGVKVPWLREAHLATDTASSVDVVLGALERETETMGSFDVVVLIEPTAPLRKSGDVDSVIRMLLKDWSRADACVTVVAANFHPSAILSVDLETEFLTRYAHAFSEIKNRRQDGPQAYLPIGNCFAIKTQALKEGQTFYTDRLLPHVLDTFQGIEIDQAEDLSLARIIWASKKFNLL